MSPSTCFQGKSGAHTKAGDNTTSLSLPHLHLNLAHNTMAPTATATESITRALPTLSLRAEGREQPSEGAQVNRGRTTSVKPRWWSELDEAEKSGKPYPYEAYLPTFDPTLKLEPLADFEHVDPGHQALSDAEPRSFLANASIEDLTPDFGSEVEGIQLSQLDARGRQQLALYVAQRGVVVSAHLDFEQLGNSLRSTVLLRLSVIKTLPIRAESGSSTIGPSSSAVPTSTLSLDSPRTFPSSTWYSGSQSLGWYCISRDASDGKHLRISAEARPRTSTTRPTPSCPPRPGTPMSHTRSNRQV